MSPRRRRCSCRASPRSASTAARVAERTHASISSLMKGDCRKYSASEVAPGGADAAGVTDMVTGLELAAERSTNLRIRVSGELLS